MKGFFYLLLIFGKLQRLGELVGTGRAASAAVNSAKPFYNLVNLHTLDKPAYTLRVAVAAAREFYIFDDAVIHLKRNLRGADTARLI